MQLPLTDFSHLRGIEREALRITKNGEIATTKHPLAFGSKLTNDTITVDFSESLLELITKPNTTINNALTSLIEVSSFCAQNMPEDELLLNASMPLTTTEDALNIADFGLSNSGQMKKIYRQGLALRYGKIMQAIAGIHYNFSFDQKLMAHMSKTRGMTPDALYFSAINHYFDFMFLLPYLFGASPICAKTSVMGKKPDYLDELDQNYYVGEYATSLRMSDFGYQSKAQQNLFISHKNITSYVKDLIQATKTPYQYFAKLGQHDKNAQRQQLNSNILQIENEYYSPIRPKQVVKRGERPACALLHRGVRYIEVRLLDINPFSEIGIDRNTSHFIEALLMTCLLLPPKKYCKKSIIRNRQNFNKVVKEGRKPQLKLDTYNHQPKLLKETGYSLIDTIEKHAKTMGSSYLEAINAQRQKLDHSDQTPSAQIISKSTTLCYQAWLLQQSQTHHQRLLKYRIPNLTQLNLQQQAIHSQASQKDLEKNDCCDIETYIESYYRLNKCKVLDLI